MRFPMFYGIANRESLLSHSQSVANLGQTEAQKAEENYFLDHPPPLLLLIPESGWSPPDIRNQLLFGINFNWMWSQDPNN